MASFEILNVTSSSVLVLVNDVSPGDTVRFFIRLSDDATDITVDETVTAEYTTCSKTYDGLIAGTDYALNVQVNSSDWIGAQYFTTDEEISENDRPEDWTWYSVISAGKKIEISALEWNDFCERINEFRRYDGLPDYDFTTVYSGETKISAAIVNQARTAITSIGGRGTLPSRARSGYPITASFFIDLANALNAVP